MQEQDGVSLDAQLQMAQDYAQRKGWDLVERFVDVQSGTRSDRASLKRLEEAVSRRAVDVVICYKIDRISRNVAHFHQVIGKLEAEGVALASLTQDIDTSTASGRLFLNILISMAQNESEQLGERVRMAKRYNAGKGRYNGWRLPLGYTHPPKDEVEEGAEAGFQVCEGEAAIVERLFSLYVETGSLHATAHTLNAEGLRTKMGGMFHPISVAYIIDNRCYEGRMESYRKTVRRVSGRRIVRRADPDDWIVTEGAFPVFLDQDLVRQARQMREQSRRESPKQLQGRLVSPWNGLIVCAECGGLFGRRHAKARGLDVFLCGARTKQGEAACKNAKQISIESLNRYILPAIESAFDAACVLGETGKIRPLAPSRKAIAQISIERSIKALSERREREKALFLMGESTKEQFQEARDRIDEQISRLRSSDAPSQVPPPVFRECFSDVWVRSDDRERNGLLRILIDSVSISSGVARIDFKRFDHPEWPTAPIEVAFRRVRRAKDAPLSAEREGYIQTNT